MRKSWTILHTFIVLIVVLGDHHTGCNARIWRTMMVEVDDIVEVVHPSLLSLPHRRRLQTGTYCVATSTADQTKLQDALDWACGTGQGNVDCSALQQGGSCYNPNTLKDHASYAFNQYYIKQNGATGSCSFNGIANITTVNPSTSTCTYPAFTGSTSTSPTTPSTSPTTPSTSTPPATPTSPSTDNSTTGFSPPSPGTFDTNTTTGTTNASPPSPTVGPLWLHALCGSISLILFLKL